MTNLSILDVKTGRRARTVAYALVYVQSLELCARRSMIYPFLDDATVTMTQQVVCNLPLCEREPNAFQKGRSEQNQMKCMRIERKIQRK